MSTAERTLRRVHDVCEIESQFALAVVEGLSKARKTLPCRYFYDARGSELFEEITRLPEYYLTRTETGILAEYAEEIADGVPNDGLLVEFGSGSSLKTEILLDRVTDLVTYVPIDVSETALDEARVRLLRRFPRLDVRPIVADFTGAVAFPPDLAVSPKSGFFPGSTIGNLTPKDAKGLLATFGDVLGSGSRLIIGVDLKKDPRSLVRAYNDAAGITASFNLNLLVRINRELHGTFDIEAFRHKAIYDPDEGRIEMHLVSNRDQSVELCARRFHFADGESIHTENSYKYRIEEFRNLAKASGWNPLRVWTDAAHQLSVHELAWPMLR
jgi:dimethylhistidine N-methyltransferase